MPRDSDHAFFGHPKGLMTLFFTEMWERFSYYGMRAFLILYIAAPPELGGRGMFILKDGAREASASAGAIVGMFGASVYLLSLPGGWIADRFLGQRKAVIVGGALIAAGNGLLAIPGLGDVFYAGLVLIAFGTGFLKPNISTMVGQLYTDTDVRRDAGYTIYYMGINIGAALAPIACGYLATDPSFRAWLSGHGFDPNWCWNVAFGAAAIGMVGGLIQFIAGQRTLGDAGIHPTVPEDTKVAQRDRTVLMVLGGIVIALGAVVVLAKPSGDLIRDTMGIGLIIGSIALFYGLYHAARNASEKRRIIAMIPLYLGAISFFAIFEQAPTTLSTFAESYTDRQLFGMYIPAPYYQFVNAAFIVGLAPVVAYLWVRLARANREPTSVTKFAIGMAILSLAFVVMLPSSSAPGAKNTGMFLIGLYFFNTIAELFISPVGLSSMSKLAPKRLGGMVMGIWFLGTSIGIYLAGRASAISAGKSFDYLWKLLLILSLVVSVALFIVSPMIKKMMAADAKATGPEDKSMKAEPEPLPEARVVKDKDD